MDQKTDGQVEEKERHRTRVEFARHADGDLFARYKRALDRFDGLIVVIPATHYSRRQVENYHKNKARTRLRVIVTGTREKGPRAGAKQESLSLAAYFMVNHAPRLVIVERVRGER